MQQEQDLTRAIHWSRHLLACLAQATEARGLVGCRAVTRHPHFFWFSSPDSDEEVLGSVENWPQEGCVLLLDSYAWDQHEGMLRKAFRHKDLVWVLRAVEARDECKRDESLLRRLKAQLYARLPKGGLKAHVKECWSEARLDAAASPYPTEIWRLGQDDSRRPFLPPSVLVQALGSWDERREDFHWPKAVHPIEWDLYREGQQDRVQDEWTGVVAAIDGSVCCRSETMGARAVIGKSATPDQSLSHAVGGPMSSLRAEAAALHGLLDVVPKESPLLILTDCLSLLTILLRWGQADYLPDEADVKHIDVIEPCSNSFAEETGQPILSR